MTSNPTFHIVVGIVGFLLLTTLLFQADTVDKLHNKEVERNLSELKQIDGELNQQVIQEQAGISPNYDAMVHLTQRLNTMLDGLTEGPQAIYHAHALVLDQSLDVVMVTLAEKVRFIEQFKSHHAVFKNSRHYFPSAISTLISRAAYKNGDPLLAPLLENFARNTLAFNATTVPDPRPILDQDIPRIQRMLKSAPVVLQQDAELLISHAQVIIREGAASRALLQRILSLPTSRQIDQVAEAYRAHVGYELRVSGVYRIYLYVAALLLMTYVGYLVVKQRRITSTLNRFRAAMDASADCMFLIDPHSLSLIDCNRAVGRELGLSREELLGMALPDLCAGCSMEVLTTRFSKLLSNGGQGTMVTSLRRKGGGEIPVEVSLNPFRDHHETVLTAVARDITERQRSEQLIRQSEQRLAESQLIAHIGTWDWDISTDSLSWTDEVYRIFGLVPQAFVATYKVFLAQIHPDDRERVQQAINAAVNATADDRVPYELDHRIVRSDGTVRTVHEQGKVFFDSDGKPQRMLGTVQDITKRVRVMEELQVHRDRLEELVVKRTLELEVTNEELEAFSYSVSHDLRAPLRAVNGFGQAMLEDCGDRLDETGMDYLKRIRAATQRMGELIDDLLTLSRVTRRNMCREAVDFSALAAKIVGRIRDGLPEREVAVTVQEGICVQGDSRLLSAALENLIGNAFKFTGHTTDAHVQIGMTERDGEPVYFVRDNGAGFDMRYAAKLFGAFQRLHRVDEFPGTGVGLATVQRIIHRHGGEVWAESKMGEGAAFFFTLPAVADELS